MQEKGFLVASDQNTEWLLPWWWDRYSSCNDHPVCFVDFGLTSQARQWCEQRGELLSLPSVVDCLPLARVQDFNPEQNYGKSYFIARSAWFKKPLACAFSPFEKTVWLDLDCEVLASLKEMFDFVSSHTEIALTFGSSVKEIKGLEEACRLGMVCNSGVVVFIKESQLIQQWAKIAQSHSEQYFGDECILSDLICRFPEKVYRLAEEYNWKMSRGVPLYAKIIHWKGEWGKDYIRKHGGLKPALSKDLHALFAFKEML